MKHKYSDLVDEKGALTELGVHHFSCIKSSVLGSVVEVYLSEHKLNAQQLNTLHAIIMKMVADTMFDIKNGEYWSQET